MERDVSLVEPFTESVPQFYTLVCLAAATGGCLGPGNNGSVERVLWFASAFTSGASANVAVYKFLFNGPVGFALKFVLTNKIQYLG